LIFFVPLLRASGFVFRTGQGAWKEESGLSQKTRQAVPPVPHRLFTQLRLLREGSSPQDLLRQPQGQSMFGGPAARRTHFAGNKPAPAIHSGKTDCHAPLPVPIKKNASHIFILKNADFAIYCAMI
jgi:hypothetical protein